VFCCKNSYLIQEHHLHHRQPPFISQQQLTKASQPAVTTHDRAQNDNRSYHFCAKNDCIDGQFLAGECAAAAVADDKDRSPMGPM